MKKVFTALCICSLFCGLTVSAAATTNETTYTEQFVKKHTQKVVDKEKDLRNKANSVKAEQKAKKAEAEQKKKEQKAKAEKKKAEQKAKLKQKQDAINTLKSW